MHQNSEVNGKTSPQSQKNLRYFKFDFMCFFSAQWHPKNLASNLSQLIRAVFEVCRQRFRRPQQISYKSFSCTYAALKKGQGQYLPHFHVSYIIVKPKMEVCIQNGSLSQREVTVCKCQQHTYSQGLLCSALWHFYIKNQGSFVTVVTFALL